MIALPLGTRIVVVGGGKMGEALVGGWIAAGGRRNDAAALDAAAFTVVDPGADRRSCLEERYGVACVPDVRCVDEADIVVLAVKPQVMGEVLDALAQRPVCAGEAARTLGTSDSADAPSPLFVSIAAGISTDRMLDALPDGAHVVRVMPNTPLLVGAGASAVCGSRTSSEAEVELVCGLFASLGDAYVVAESQMDAVCALSGSGPAYMALMIESLRDAAVRQGLDARLAEELALKTMYGTCRLIMDTGQTPEQTRLSVCSPGGTTLAALDAMGTAGFSTAIECGVAAASRRSKELSAC